MEPEAGGLILKKGPSAATTINIQFTIFNIQFSAPGRERLVTFTKYLIIILNIIYNRWLYGLVNITYRGIVKKFFKFLDHKSGVVFEFCSNFASKVVAGRFGFIKEKMGQTAAVGGTETGQRQDNASCLGVNFSPLMFTSGLIVGIPYFASS